MTKTIRSKKRFLFPAATLFVIASIAGAVVFSKVKQAKPRELPRVLSKIKNLEVLSTTIIDADSPAARVRLEIQNNSAVAVMAVDIVAGDGAIARSGLTDDEHPIVVIEPYGTTTMEMSFGEMTPGAPLVVSAVTYADGTEEGEQESLEIMHKILAHDKAQLRAEREKEKGGTKP